MGSVQASEAKPKTFAEKSTDTDDDDLPIYIPCHDSVDRKPGNPGCFEDIHKKVKKLYPQNFEGAKLIVKKILSEHFSTTHVITLSSVTPSGYKFGTKYIGCKSVGPFEKYPIATGEIAPNGNLSANFVHTLGCRFRFKLATQIADQKFRASSSCLEYRSDDATVSVTLDNPQFLKQEGTVVLRYLQSITSRIALGAELAYFRGPELPGMRRSVMCLAFRRDTGDKTFSGTFGNADLHLCYYSRASDQLELGVELDTDFRRHRSVATIVYQLNFPHAHMNFKGIVNSESTVGAVFEKKLNPISESSLIVSGMLNHRRQQFRVGIGLSVG